MQYSYALIIFNSRLLLKLHNRRKTGKMRKLQPFVQKLRCAYSHILSVLCISWQGAPHEFTPPLIVFVQNIKDETANALEQLKEAESEAKALRTMTQRMILTHEEMVVL